MSLTETPTSTVKRKSRRKRSKRATAAAQPKAAPMFSGLTANDCCGGCNAAGCVISGRPYCAHPFKGGLQGRDLQNDAAIERLTAATKTLGKAKIKLDKI